MRQVRNILARLFYNVWTGANHLAPGSYLSRAHEFVTRAGGKFTTDFLFSQAPYKIADGDTTSAELTINLEDTTILAVFLAGSSSKD